MWNPSFIQQSKIFDQLKNWHSFFSKCNTWPTLDDYNELQCTNLKNKKGRSITFIPQQPKTTVFEQQYEPKIYLAGEVQTREQNWHDFFNMLVWHQFSHTKARINAIHYQEQKQRLNKTKQRTSIENALTLFDENGVIVLCQNQHLIDLLKQHRWQELFWHHREAVVSEMRFIIFGHALFEKALNPYIGMTGKAIFLDLQLDASLVQVDSVLEQYVSENVDSIDTLHLQPLPVLGVPGWYDNDFIEFYQNQEYFRPKRVCV